MKLTAFKQTTKSVLCAAYKYSGAAGLCERFLCSGEHTQMVILLFHRVTDEIPPDGLTVSTQLFRRMCRMLQRSFQVKPLGEIVRLARSGSPLPPRTATITFDDCYHDNLAAARVLADHGLPATFFVPSAHVGTEHVFPWDKHLPRRLTNLSWDDVRAMARLGHEIGSHTRTHLNLGEANPEQARTEIIDSRREIQDQTGQEVRWFAIPFGEKEHFRVEWLDLVQEAGYTACFSAHGGFIERNHPGLLLPREPVPYFHSVTNLELYLRGTLHWFYGWKKQRQGKDE